jgi:flagellar protein FlaF
MRHDPRNAYEAGAKTAVTNRELEATALFKAARKLEACMQAWDAPDHAQQLDEALRYNLRLWTLFQCELAQPDHEIVPALRRDLLRLSAFVDKRTFEVMASPEPKMLQALIDIDRNIAMGLSTAVPTPVE